LNYALGSCGELHSAYYAFHQAAVINNEVFDEIDAQHYKTENKLLKLIQSLQQKFKDGNWEDDFTARN
jgi:hypothetical protein